MENKIFEILGLDGKIAYQGRKIKKKTFLSSTDLSKSHERVFNEEISRIELSYVLVSSNINIDTYKDEERNYSSVGYIYAEVKKTEKMDQIARIIHGSFPDPTVIIFASNEKISISTALKRKSKNDFNKVVVEELNTTNWIDLENLDEDTEKFLNSISLSSLDYTNFFKFYKSMHDSLYLFNNLDITGQFSEDSEIQKRDRAEVVQEINALEKEFDAIVKKLKKESKMSNRIKLNVEATELRRKIDDLKLLIKE